MSGNEPQWIHIFVDVILLGLITKKLDYLQKRFDEHMQRHHEMKSSLGRRRYD